MIPVRAGEMYEHTLRVHFWVKSKNGTWIHRILFRSNLMGEGGLGDSKKNIFLIGGFL